MDKQKWRVTALVPCYNEESRIGQVLSVLQNSPYITSIIVINDGSTDNSKSVVQSFKNIQLIDLPKNLGKGDALKKAIDKVTTPITFLCDADLTGLNDGQIQKMILPVVNEGYHVCVGVRKRWGSLGQWLRRNALPLIAGERVIRTDVLKKILASPLSSGWGLEPYMNDYVSRHRLKMKKVDLEGVMDISHAKKRGVLTFLRRNLIQLAIYGKILFFGKVSCNRYKNSLH